VATCGREFCRSSSPVDVAHDDDCSSATQ
jgi:hypothetical protein